MYKWIMAVLFTGACILGISIMIAQTPKSAEEIAKEEANQLKLTATNFQFDKEKYTVEKGSKLKVILNNKQGVHGVEIEGLDVKLEGDKLSQEVTFDKPGTYKVKCIVMCGDGHAAMVSELVVQ